MNKVNLLDKFALVDALWTPKIAGTVNDCHVKLARIKGEFVWHHHEDEDELFLVVKGRMTIRTRDGDVTLEEGEFCVVPRGTEHQPVAEEEAWNLLIEPASTLNTGNVSNEFTVERLETI